MSGVTLAGTLPGDDRNGLASLATQLLDNPDDIHVVVALIDCSKITENTDTGDRKPTIRIRAIEPITAHTDATEMRRLLRRAYERRTGQTELPLELEREFEQLTGGLDDDNGSE